MTPGTNKQAADALFAGIAWDATALGPVEGWPVSLRVAVRLCLDTRTAMAVWAGPDFTLIYNEGYASVLGDKHPGAMGRPASEVWAEVWDAREPEFRLAFEHGSSTRHEDGYFASSLTPIREEDGRIVGLFNVLEVHRRSESRQAFLLQLGDALRPLADAVEIQGVAARLLRAHLQASRVHYGEVEPDDAHVVVARDHAHGVPDRAGRYALSDFPLFAVEGGAGRSLVLHEAATDPRLSPDEQHQMSCLPVQAAVIVPLLKEGRLAALLAVHQERPRSWSSDEIAVIEETAERTWEAVTRARSEQALRTSEARFRRTLENMLEGCAILSFDWTYLFVNKANAGHARSTPEGMVGRRLHEIVPGVEASPFFEAYRRCMQERTPQRVESGFTFADGTSSWFAAVAEPVPEGIFVRVQDITARKRDEQAMRASRAFIDEQRARLQAIVDTIPVGLFVTESDGRVVLTNDEAIRVWAGTVRLERIEDYAEYIGFWPDTGERLKAEEWPAARALVHGLETRELVVDIERFDGTRGTIVVSGAPIRDAEGRTTGAVVAMQDISELRDTQKRLEQADRRKDHFLAVLSHELRNPLAPIKNGLYILDRVPAGGPQAQRARDVIGRQVDQLSHLVDDLLDLTRINRGKVQLQRRRLELNALVTRTLDDHLTEFEAARIDVHLEPAPQPIFIDADYNRIAQVLSNLLQNAAKFTQPGGQVTVKTETDASGSAVLRVVDTGRGITSDLLAKLFEPFTQADTTLDRREGGLGLGLALVKGLVEQHGGSIEAHSDGCGRGAALTVRLPLDNPPQLADPEVALVSTGSQRPRRVLVIEDNVDAAQILQQVLELDGHEVAVAYTGPDGLDLARQFHPDLVFCDIGLPGMDGYAVARAFRADQALEHTHLVALSGYALPEDRARAAEAGFEQHLTKPASLDALEQVLREGR